MRVESISVVLLREALARCDSGNISGDENKIVLTIRVDARNLFIEFEAALCEARTARLRALGEEWWRSESTKRQGPPTSAEGHPYGAAGVLPAGGRLARA